MNTMALIMGSTEIADAIRRKRLSWTGHIRRNGLLITIGSPLQAFSASAEPVDPFRAEQVARCYAAPLAQWHEYTLEPQTLVLAQSTERIALAHDLVAYAATLSHLARLGLAIHLCSPWIEPGYDGFLTLEIANFSPTALVLRKGMAVGKIKLFRQCTSESPKPSPYGADGALASQFHVEFGDDAAASY